MDCHRLTTFDSHPAPVPSVRRIATVVVIALVSAALVPAALASTSRAAGVNAVIPRFHLSFADRVVGGGLHLTKLTISPFSRRSELTPAGGCVLCSGAGRFKPSRIFEDRYVEAVAHGALVMDRRTRFVEVLSRANRIGRFVVYGLGTGPTARVPIALLSGCTPANLDVSDARAFNFRTLPRVPCSAPKAHGDNVTISAPTELSTTQTKLGQISGHSTGGQWLIAFQSDSAHRCSPDALAEEDVTDTFFQRRVNGRFSIRYTTAPSPSPGFTCAYLQSGGRVRVGTGHRLVLPDGRVTATASRTYFSGDTIGVTGPASAVPSEMTAVTVAGTASAKEQAYFFAPPTPCRASAQAEFAVEPSFATVPENIGSFSTAVTIFISPSAPPTVYECAYLQVGTPTKSSGPVGPTLATGTGTITITGSTTPQPAAR